MGYRKVAFAKSIVFSYATKISLLVSGVVYTYLIANYLGPSEYGIVSYYIALIIEIINVAGIYFLQSHYNLFIPRSKSKSFFMKVLGWQYCLAIVLFIFVFAFSESIAMFLHKDEFLFLRYAAFLLLLLPLYDSFMFLFRGFKCFGKVLKTEVVVSVMNVCLAFLLIVSLSFGIYGVIYARIISLFIGIIMFVYFFRELPFLDRMINMTELKTYSYGAFMTNLFKSLTTFSFTIFIGMFISTTMLGLFYIAQKLIGYVVASIQSAISEAVVPFVADDYKDKEFLNRYFSYSVKLSLVISLFTVIVLVLMGKFLLEVLLPKYVLAYDLIVLYSIVASIWSFNVLNSAYLSQNRMDILAKMCFMGLLFNIIFSVVLMPIYGVYGAIYTLAIVGVAQALFSLYHLKDLGLNVDVIVRPDDLKIFFGVIKICYRRLLGARGYY